MSCHVHMFCLKSCFSISKLDGIFAAQILISSLKLGMEIRVFLKVQKTNISAVYYQEYVFPAKVKM